MADSTKSVGYEITAENAKFVKAMEGCASATQGATSAIKGHLDGVGKAFEAVQKQLLILAAVVAGGAFFKEAISESQKLTGETMTLSKRLGITAEEASALNTALGDIGSDSETYISAFDKFAKQLRTNEEGLQQMGLKTRDANGHLRDSDTLFREALAQVGEYKAGLDQTTAAQTLFGKGVDDVMRLQRLNNQVLDDAREKNKELGLVVTKEGVEASKAYKAAMNDVGDVLTAVKNVVGQAVMPIFARLGEWLASIGPAAVKLFRVAIDSVATGFWALKAVVTGVWETINAMVVTVAEPVRALASAMAAAVQGDWAAAKAELVNIPRVVADAWQQADRAIQASGEDSADHIRKLWGDGTALGKPKSGSRTMGEFKDGKEKDKADKSRLPQWEAELAGQKSAYEAQQAQAGTFHRYTLSQELVFWEQKAALAKSGTAEEAATAKKVAELRLQILRQQHEEELQIDAINIDRARSAALARIDAEQEAARLQVDLGAMSQADLIAAEQVFEDRRTEIRRQALRERFALAAQDPERNRVELARINAEAEALEEEHQARLQQIRNRAAIEANKPFAGLVSSLESTWSGLIARIADGQMTLNSFLRSLFSGTFQAITQTLAQIGLKWVAQRTGLADLETALLGKQRAEEGAAAVASIASKKAEAAAVIPAEAATAAGGAASAVAGIPIVGPALAAEAFAATMAMVMGGLGLASASGGYDIPAGVNPLVQAHAQEMILPAKYADVIRGLADGGGGSGGGGASGPVHMTVQAFNARDVVRGLADGGAVTRALQLALREGRGFKR